MGMLLPLVCAPSVDSRIRSQTPNFYAGMMHESGTGGAPKYGIIPQMPLTDVAPPVNILDNLTYSQPRVRLCSTHINNS